MFYEKLNYLMDITGTQNSVLAAAVKMDASHISRLRHGSRVPPKNQNYILPISRFFARNIKDDFQKNVLCGMLHIAEFPKEEETTAKLICAWLNERTDSAANAAAAFVAGFASVRQPHQSPPVRLEENVVKTLDGCYYIGNDGKRAAVIRFLTAVINESNSQTLLLFSDEEMSWMTEDAVFGKRWAELLTAVLRQGNRIKIVHTINRNADEMMEAVTKWVPVYVTGLIEPYYYPKLRDGVFQRTMFIAPKTAAVIASSVSHNSDEMLNLYIEQPSAILALVAEYERYFSLCRPLMRIFGAVNAERYFEDFIDFSANEASAVMLTPVPSLMTMPEEVARSIAKRHNLPQFYELWRHCFGLLDVNLSRPFTEIITTAPKDSDTIPLPMADMFRSETLFYTKEEYALHLEHILSLMKEHKNYTALMSGHIESIIMIWGKEDVGILMARTESPSTVFAFSEQNMTAAFWAYLVKQCQSVAYRTQKQSITSFAETVQESGLNG